MRKQVEKIAYDLRTDPRLPAMPEGWPQSASEGSLPWVEAPCALTVTQLNYLNTVLWF